LIWRNEAARAVGRSNAAAPGARQRRSRYTAAMIAAGAPFYLAALPAAALVGASKGGLPAVGMLAVPVLSLIISPIAAAGLLLPIFVATDLFGVLAYRRSYSARNLLVLIPGCTLGVAFGWATAAIVSEGAVTLLIGAIGLGFVLYSWTRRADVAARPADWTRGLAWGALTGFTSFVSHSGAPPYQVYVLPQKLEKLAYAGTTTILFAIVNTLLTVRLVQRMPEKLFFTLVQVALLLISLKLVADGVRMLATA
jgi:hypothetical protein